MIQVIFLFLYIGNIFIKLLYILVTIVEVYVRGCLLSRLNKKQKIIFYSIIIITKSVDQTGLSFYKKAVSAHGRMIAVEDGEDKVSIYYFRISVSKVEKNDFY